MSLNVVTTYNNLSKLLIKVINITKWSSARGVYGARIESIYNPGHRLQTILLCL